MATISTPKKPPQVWTVADLYRRFGPIPRKTGRNPRKRTGGGVVVDGLRSYCLLPVVD
jgi:hypothetical protein